MQNKYNNLNAIPKAYGYEDIQDNIRRESIKPRRTKRRMTVAEIRRDTFKQICKKVLPVVLATGIGIGAAGGHTISNFVSDINSNKYLVDHVHEFQRDYIGPNTKFKTNINKDTGEAEEIYYYEYYDIAQGIKNAENQDEAIFYCYENIGSLQTGKVIDYVGYDTFMGYIESKGFTTLEEYEDFMKKEIALRSEINKEEDELAQMMNDHPITDTVEANTYYGGK